MAMRRFAPARDGDLELAARAGSGDADAFAELYARHVDQVHVQITRLIGPVADREDVLQQVFLTAEQMRAWGWRIPFVIGAMLGVTGNRARGDASDGLRAPLRGARGDRRIAGRRDIGKAAFRRVRLFASRAVARHELHFAVDFESHDFEA